MPTDALDRLLKALREGTLFTPGGIGALLELVTWAWKAYWEKARPDLVPITLPTSTLELQESQDKLRECCECLRLRIPAEGDPAVAGINPLVLAIVRKIIELLLENVMSESVVCGAEEEDSLRNALAAIQHLEDLVEGGSRA